ncbi:hypothetical protein [Arthrobacter sp. SW1]|uniref:hypothetical protein n=1 Tax=Arthrobacter sp. SW1 TaxID=1920889 RepID=UPI001495BB26|nr:hypothetical protein [Arthrobacter sp. SW1]
MSVAYTNPASPYVYFYRDYNYGEPHVIFKEGGGSNDLRNQMMTSTRNWDDEISSIKG